MFDTMENSFYEERDSTKIFETMERTKKFHKQRNITKKNTCHYNDSLIKIISVSWGYGTLLADNVVIMGKNNKK